MLHKNGFTLMELAIVLVIIGLIAGGVLVGKDLIQSTRERSVITQLEKYNTAVQVFKGKYLYLPGDFPATSVSGFPTRARTLRRGNGDGRVQSGNGENNLCNEVQLFWTDLYIAGIISDSTDSGTDAAHPNCYAAAITDKAIMKKYFPESELSDALVATGIGSSYLGYRNHYYLLAGITQIYVDGTVDGVNVIPAQSAYNIDLKIDDASAVTGNVFAFYYNKGGNEVRARTPALAACQAGGSYKNTTAGAACQLAIGATW